MQDDFASPFPKEEIKEILRYTGLRPVILSRQMEIAVLTAYLKPMSIERRGRYR